MSCAHSAHQSAWCAREANSFCKQRLHCITNGGGRLQREVHTTIHSACLVGEFGSYAFAALPGRTCNSCELQLYLLRGTNQKLQPIVLFNCATCVHPPRHPLRLHQLLHHCPARLSTSSTVYLPHPWVGEGPAAQPRTVCFDACRGRPVPWPSRCTTMMAATSSTSCIHMLASKPTACLQRLPSTPPQLYRLRAPDFTTILTLPNPG